MKSSIVLCKLTYLLTYLQLPGLTCRLTGCTFIVRMLYTAMYMLTFILLHLS